MSDTDSPSRSSPLLQRLSRCGLQVLPGVSSQRRWRLQRQQEAADPSRGGGTVEGPLTLPFSNSAVSQRDQDWARCTMEHAWMLCAAGGNLKTILDLLTEDPHLLTRRDFISGFSVLHWLAKKGEDEALLQLLRFAETRGVPVDVNLRGSGGFTPLHVASMHGQHMVIKLLVGAFGADVELMDHSGKRPWQYLRGTEPQELRELLGTWDHQIDTGDAHIISRNSSIPDVTSADEVDAEPSEEENSFERRSVRSSSWRFGSLRKILQSRSFVGNRT